MIVALISGFVLSFLGSMPLAGPISILVFGRGLRGRYRSALFIAFGAALAEGAYAFLAYWGLTTLVQRFPRVTDVFQVLGAVVLLGLGVAFIVAYGREQPAEPAADDKRDKSKRSFLLGFTITALNPTFLATWSAAITVLHSLGLASRQTLAALPFAGGVIVGASSWFWLMLELLRRHKHRINPKTLQRLLQGIGVALTGMGIWMGVRAAMMLARW